MSARAGTLVTYYYVLTDTAADGPACDGLVVARFRTRVDAERHASTATTYGRPATVREDRVPVRIAARYGVA